MRRFLFVGMILGLFFSLALAMNAFAATYYVATTGKDTNPGTEAEPWATLTYAESSISDGDTVIVRGGTYNEIFTINVPNVTFQNYTSESPIIDKNESGGGRWTALVKLDADGITFDGFEVRESTGHCIIIAGDDVTVKNCIITISWESALQVGYNITNALIEDCTISYGAKNRDLHEYPSPYGANVSIVNSLSVVIRRCRIYNSYYEGIDLIDGCNSATIEYCEIYGNEKLQVYLSCSKDCTVRYNLIYGTSEGTGPGIWIGGEDWCHDADEDTGHKVYGNLVANCKRNLLVAGEPSSRAVNSVVYNNTFVEASYANVSYIWDVGSGHEFKNNIIWQTTGTIAEAKANVVAADHNLWSKEPDADIRGPNGPVYAAPQLKKTSGWNQLSAGDLYFSDFSLKGTSHAINAGIKLQTEFANVLECDESTGMRNLVLYNQDNKGSHWEIGADIHVGLGRPTNLRIPSPQ